MLSACLQKNMFYSIIYIVYYLLKATVIVSVELAQGQRASGFKPFASNAFRKESQADKDPRKKNN